MSLAKYHNQFREVKKKTCQRPGETREDYLYMLTTPSREELEQMILKTFGQRYYKMRTGRIGSYRFFYMYSKVMSDKFVKYCI